ncbi:TPA: hypothetical protein ACM3ZK_004156 [Escherichia coli]
MRNANEGVSLTEAILAIRGIDKYASYKTIKTIKTIIITIVLIILALAFFSLASSLVSAAGRVAVAIQAVCYLCLCMAIIIMVVIKISSFIDERREKLELKRAELDKIKIKARQKIYKRLRYVENDHIVFDPVTGREVPAKWACIHHVRPGYWPGISRRWMQQCEEGSSPPEGYDEMYRRKHHLIKIFLLRMACNVFSFLLGAFTLSAPFVFYTLIGSVLNAVIHFIFSLPLAAIFLAYAYSGFKESIYLFMAYKYDSSKS